MCFFFLKNKNLCSISVLTMGHILVVSVVNDKKKIQVFEVLESLKFE